MSRSSYSAGPLGEWTDTAMAAHSAEPQQQGHVPYISTGDVCHALVHLGAWSPSIICSTYVKSLCSHSKRFCNNEEG